MRKRPAAWLMLLVVVGLVAAACGNNKKSSSTASTTTTEAAKKGGSIVIGAEQWPTCLNPDTQCANASWMHFVADEHVLPKLIYIDPTGTFKPTAVLKDMPTEANGGVKFDPLTITYHINPAAVWDDGTPITSADVEFSWQAHTKTTGVISTVGYDQIASIDTSDPHTAVVKFSKFYADWQDLFGGNSDYVLKKAAFPSGPEISQAMQDSIPFSGGPWKLQSWSKDQSVLVPNPKYWVKADMPLLDQVTFVPRTDADTQINSLLSGEVAVIEPQPSPGISKKLAAPNVKSSTGYGASYENLWMNESQKPLDDPIVRHAIFMATDREAIINTVIRPDVPEAKLLGCAVWVPTIGKWCDGTQYDDIKYDPTAAKKLLTDNGWTAGSDGIMTKGGQKLDIEFNVVAGNTRREQIQQLMIQQAKPAGITYHVKNYDRTKLFSEVLPHLNHHVSVYVNNASPDPSVTSFLACESIPKAPDFAGQNNSAWCDQAATDLMHKADNETDETKRIDLTHQIGKAIHDDFAILPFYQFPLVPAWRTDKIAGPIDTFKNSSYYVFYNMNKWHTP